MSRDFVASVYSNDVFTCSAAILSSKWVLTAAHCVVHRETYTLRVKTTTNVILPVVQKRCHVGYDRVTLSHDICLLKLHAPYDGVPVLWSDDRDPRARSLFATGFDGVALSSKRIFAPLSPHTMSMELVSRDTCQARLYPFRVRDGMFCAHSAEPNSNVCSVSSGSTLTTLTLRGAVFHGLLSWTTRCGAYPGVFINTSHYRSWIRDELFRADCACKSATCVDGVWCRVPDECDHTLLLDGASKRGDTLFGAWRPWCGGRMSEEGTRDRSATRDFRIAWWGQLDEAMRALFYFAVILHTVVFFVTLRRWHVANEEASPTASSTDRTPTTSPPSSEDVN